MKPHILIFEGTVPKTLKAARYVAKNIDPMGRLDKVEGGFKNKKSMEGRPSWGLYKSDYAQILISSFKGPQDVGLNRGDVLTILFQEPLHATDD